MLTISKSEAYKKVANMETGLCWESSACEFGGASGRVEVWADLAEGYTVNAVI